MTPLLQEKESPVKGAFRLAWHIFASLLVAFVLLVVATLGYERFVKKSAVPSFCGYSMLIIATPSMEEELSAGDAVLIKRSKHYSVGDVITYLPVGESVTVTHRIVRTEGDRFYTKGDANPTEDPVPVYAEQIAGKVVLCLPVAGKVARWLKTAEGLLFLVTGVVLIALLIVVVKKD